MSARADYRDGHPPDNTAPYWIAVFQPRDEQGWIEAWPAPDTKSLFVPLVVIGPIDPVPK